MAKVASTRRTAEKTLEHEFMIDSWPTLRHYNEGWYLYEDGVWADISKDAVHSILRKLIPSPSYYAFLTIVKEIQGLVETTLEPPSWLDHPDIHPPLNVRNGLLAPRKGLLAKHEPRLWSMNQIGVDYDSEAKCPRWDSFIEEALAPDDAKQLQAWFGYVLSHDDSRQKAFLGIGPPGSGKSTVGMVLDRLMGESSVSMSMSALSSNFGMSAMINKSLAVFPDIRVAEKVASLERLLSIVGNDKVLVDRKNKSLLSVQLGKCRVMIFANGLPTLPDTSSAMMRRLVMVEFRPSLWPDPEIWGVLETELSGILNWAIRGIGKDFETSKSATRMMTYFSEVSSPIRVFSDECLLPAPEVKTSSKEVYGAYRQWCRVNGHLPVANTKLKPQLKEAGVNFTDYKTATERGYEGIELSPAGHRLYQDGLYV